MALPHSNLQKLTLYDVARAVEEDRIAINFQPIVRANDTRFVMFHEGLIRLFDQNGDLRVAGEFIDAISGSEIGNYVDQCALELVLHRLKIDPAVRASVNMSMYTLWDEDWVYLLESAGRHDRSITERLIVEFTEQSVMEDIHQAIEFMKYCRQFGVCFAVDDFGAGNTVLGHLRDLSFDMIKIDGHITRDVGENPDSQILTRAIIEIARYFEMTTVAEFIDNPSAAQKCKELGVDGLQGFYFGKGELFNPSHPNLVVRQNMLKHQA